MPASCCCRDRHATLARALTVPRTAAPSSSVSVIRRAGGSGCGCACVCVYVGLPPPPSFIATQPSHASIASLSHSTPDPIPSQPPNHPNTSTPTAAAAVAACIAHRAHLSQTAANRAIQPRHPATPDSVSVCSCCVVVTHTPEIFRVTDTTRCVRACEPRKTPENPTPERARHTSRRRAAASVRRTHSTTQRTIDQSQFRTIYAAVWPVITSPGAHPVVSHCVFGCVACTAQLSPTQWDPKPTRNERIDRTHTRKLMVDTWDYPCRVASHSSCTSSPRIDVVML